MKVITIRAAKNHTMNFTECFAIVMAGMPVRELAMNRFTPTGGVTNPMARFAVIIMPKCTGWIPAAEIIGIKIGVHIRIAETESMDRPIKRRKAFITRRSIILDDIAESINAANCCGA